MPPAARKYGPVAYSKHPAGTKRPSSLSLSEMMGSVDCKELDLLSVAFSDLSSNHSDSLEVIPPFPRIRKPTVAEFINLRSNLLCSQGSPLIGECSVLRNRGKVVTTGPTAPRLKTMLREVVSVKKWRENASIPYASGHIPWGGLADVPPKPWIFEGSMFSADDYRAQRADLRQCRQLQTPRHPRATSMAPYKPQLSDLGSCASVLPTSSSFRETLVFEQDITLQTDGQSKRWSLQVPAKEMNPEMVDMMLELHNLKSYFGETLNKNDEQKIMSETEFIPPTLLVSNSTIAMPIPLNSSPRLASDVPLAVRRGKQLPESLTFKGDEYDMPYPGMPTAFLGSPSSCSPKFEHVNHGDVTSMNLDDMVASLRSRCASLGSCMPSVSRIYNQETLPQSSRDSMASFSEDRHVDEWAFANTLMDTCGDRFLPDDTPTSMSLSDNGSPFRFGTDTAPVAASPKTNVHALRAQLPRPSAQHFLDHVTPPPTIPLPPRPVLSPIKRVRGILKSTKSVRFASLPDDDNQSLVVPPRILAPASVVLSNPSSIHQCLDPDCEGMRPNKIRLVPAKTVISPPPKSLTAGTVPKRSSTSRRASESSAFRSIIRRPSMIIPVRKATSNQPRSAPSSLGRHSIGAKMGKENRARSSSTPVHPSRFVLDENTLKRARENNTRDSGSHKSRMPIAVRNIFTRFK